MAVEEDNMDVVDELGDGVVSREVEEEEVQEVEVDAEEERLRRQYTSMGIRVDEFGMPIFDEMPSEEQLAEARRTTPATPFEGHADDDGEGAGDQSQREGDGDDELKLKLNQPAAAVVDFKLVRQTLLYSATALRIDEHEAKNKNSKKWLSKAKGKAPVSEAVKALPICLQQLLVAVAVQPETKVVDVTGIESVVSTAKEGVATVSSTATPVTGTGSVSGTEVAAPLNKRDKKRLAWEEKEKASRTDIDGEATKANEGSKKRGRSDENEEEAVAETEEEVTEAVGGGGVGTGTVGTSTVGTVSVGAVSLVRGVGSIPALPKGLSQFEYRMPTEEKDVLAYYYLIRVSNIDIIYESASRRNRRATLVIE
jgi:hypothetical protein